jgi:predicted dienelactone hydrolase
VRIDVSIILVTLVLAASPALAAHWCSADATTASFDASGRFPVGERTLQLVDTSRATPPHADDPGAPDRTLVTEVWYPAASEGRDAPLASGGAFPLVVNSPGLLDNRLGEAYYARHLASRGFVVASLDFPLTNSAWIRRGPFLGDVHNQPGDVSFVLDRLLTETRDAADWLHGGVDRHRIGATGLSLGAVTTLLVTYHPTLRDRRIRAALPIAPGGGCAVNRRFFSTMRPQILTIVGEQDLILPPDANALPAIDLLRSPRTLVTFVAATHTAFSGLVGFPSKVSYDVLGCTLLTGIAGWGNPFDGLGGPADGITSTDISCSRICKDPVPANVPMQAERQQQLTQVVEAAFFESALRHSRSARCFLRQGLAAENADVHVAFLRGRAY